MPKRSPVVDQLTVDLEWEIINLTSLRFDYYDRCVLEGLGGSVSGSSYQGTLDPGGIITAYKCSRTQGSSFALRAFSNNRRKIHVHLRMDNRTAVAYLLNMRGKGSQVLVGIAQELWEYALRKEISLKAKYLPGDMNHEADCQSRHFRDSSKFFIH